MNGRTKGDMDGHFTCLSSSVVDYCISTSKFLTNISDMNIVELSHLYSDGHNTLEITVKRTEHDNLQRKNNILIENTRKIKGWNSNLTTNVLENINLANKENINQELD